MQKEFRKMSKIKQEKIAPELDSARSKLDGVLQHLMERTDESQSSSDESTKTSPEIVVKEPSPVTSPTKKQTHRTQRKRRRKDDVTTKNTNSYILKLYDRSVDLAPFSENTPLYPVCRAWIHNQPNSNSIHGHNQSSSSSVSQELHEDIKDDCKAKLISQLPPPLKHVKTENGEVRDLRIPSPIPREQEEFIICSDDQGAPSKEFLMSKHMERWRAVRQKWKQAAIANEDRYRESGMILKAIFEREGPVSDQWDSLTAA